MTYIKPSLNIVGKVADVVLGAIDQGFDLDGTLLPDGAEFEAGLPGTPFQSEAE